jgi:hypothetical protein
MRMSRDVDLIAAAIFSAEHVELEPIKCLADLDLNPARTQHVQRFGEIVGHLQALPFDIQHRLADVAALSFRLLDCFDGPTAVRSQDIQKFRAS